MLALAGGLVATMVLAQLNAPWNRYANGWEGAFYSLIAQVRLQDGLFNLAAPQALVTGTLRTPYLNHPPLTGLLVALSFQLLGTGEAQARLVGLIAAVGSALLFYKVVQRTCSTSAAKLAVLALVSMPMFVVYADLVSDVGPLELVFLMGVLFCLERYLAGRDYALPLGGLFGMLAFFVDYAVVFRLPPLVVALAVAGAERKRLFAYTFGISTAILLALGAYLYYVYWYYGSFGFLMDKVAVRTGITPPVRYSLSEWARQISTFHILLLSPFVIGTVVLYGVECIQSRFSSLREHPSKALLLITVLLLFGVSYVLVGNSGAYAHEYWSYYLLPGYALVAGVAWDRAFRGPQARVLTRWAWCLALPYVALFTDRIGEPGVSLLSRPGVALALATAGGLFVLRKKSYLPILAMSAFVCLNLLVAWKFRVSTEISDRDMGALVGGLTQPGDLIVTTGNSVPQQWYYSGRTIVPNSAGVGAELDGWDLLLAWQNGVSGLSAFVRAHEPVYLQLAELWPPRSNAAVMDWLERNCAYREVAPRLMYVERCDE
jgi:4-amino-4-deoxy-L-arabinose transferase-like glycosyltransferase